MGDVCTGEKLREELTRALLEAKDDDNNEGGGIESFNQLVQEMTLKQQDVKAFAFRTKAMVLTLLILTSHLLCIRFIFPFKRFVLFRFFFHHYYLVG